MNFLLPHILLCVHIYVLFFLCVCVWCEISNICDCVKSIATSFYFSLTGTGALASQIPHLACTVYHITLKDLPAMVRLWWNSCEKRVFSVVDKFTSKYVSSVLSSQEISSVQTSTQLFNGMTVSETSCSFFIFFADL